MNAQITIAVQCHDFQRRFAWMLSSLAQQTQPGLVAVDVAHMRNNGKPTTEEVVAVFGRLEVRRSEFLDFSSFQRRGCVRNLQIQECKTEWLMFGDCDMVYHPKYFELLIEELNRNHARATWMISSGRMSNPKEHTNALVNHFVTDKAVEVRDAFEFVNRGLEKRPMRNVGAGFCQLINHRLAPHENYYVDPGSNRDWDWNEKGSNPKSDMQFRKRINAAGGARRNLPIWFSENAIHLNHNRDPDVGKHLEEQR